MVLDVSKPNQLTPFSVIGPPSVPKNCPLYIERGCVCRQQHACQWQPSGACYSNTGPCALYMIIASQISLKNSSNFMAMQNR